MRDRVGSRALVLTLEILGAWLLALVLAAEGVRRGLVQMGLLP